MKRPTPSIPKQLHGFRNRTCPTEWKISSESEKKVDYFGNHISGANWHFEICDLIGRNSKLSIPIGRPRVSERWVRPKPMQLFRNGGSIIFSYFGNFPFFARVPTIFPDGGSICFCLKNRGAKFVLDDWAYFFDSVTALLELGFKLKTEKKHRNESKYWNSPPAH